MEMRLVASDKHPGSSIMKIIDLVNFVKIEVIPGTLKELHEIITMKYR